MLPGAPVRKLWATECSSGRTFESIYGVVLKQPIEIFLSEENVQLYKDFIPVPKWVRIVTVILSGTQP